MAGACGMRTVGLVGCRERVATSHAVKRPYVDRHGATANLPCGCSAGERVQESAMKTSWQRVNEGCGTLILRIIAGFLTVGLLMACGAHLLRGELKEGMFFGGGALLTGGYTLFGNRR